MDGRMGTYRVHYRFYRFYREANIFMVHPVDGQTEVQTNEWTDEWIDRWADILMD